MCTVSFVANNNHVIITSNRDENINRPDAHEIETIASECNTRLYYPKDPSKGGSWFVVTDSGHTAVLLNGAFEKHNPAYPYVKSRGIILLELLKKYLTVSDFEKIYLEGVEPFTVIYYTGKNLYELRWDGNKKHSRELLCGQAHIWSSATLYDAAARNKKENYFKDFIGQHASINENDITHFHLQKGNDMENGFVIKRNNGIQTRSLTQAVISSSHIQLMHHTLADSQTISKHIPITSSYQ